ncbi:hypothetical protein DERP_012823 [Dermatophagoides pteronyssinus]|uniref:Uncharacterized protein n=1 Tax=Dermatophagoides pteronyssinus TaxID=6956 RepID=A0ABQ8JF53_DERPT|nr:hypothetical protein DERP_012823 [Dermatophagoides pteronyssinus]
MQRSKLIDQWFCFDFAWKIPLCDIDTGLIAFGDEGEWPIPPPLPPIGVCTLMPFTCVEVGSGAKHAITIINGPI